MEGGPLLTDWWVKESAKHILYLNVASRVDSHPDQGMLQKKGGRGFPYVVFMDAKGDILEKFRPSSAQALEAAEERAKALVALGEKVAANPKDHGAKARYLMAKLNLLPSEENEKELEKIFAKGGIDEKTQGEFRDYKSGKRISEFFQEMNTEMRKAQGEDGRAEKVAEFQKKAYALYKEGLVPPEAGSESINFYAQVCEGAIAAKDKATAEKALAPLKAFAEENPRAKPAIKKLEDKLESL